MKHTYTYAPDLLEKMEHIRNRYVKHWKTDFYHDVRTLMNLWMSDNPYDGWKDFTAVWLVRECGTNLFILDEGQAPFDNALVKCILDNNGWDNVRTYLIKGEKEKDHFTMNLTFSPLKKPC